MTRKVTYMKKRIWASSLLAQFLLFYLLSKMPWAGQATQSFFEWQKPVHQRLFSQFPFSLGDVFYVLLAFALAYLVLKALTPKSRSKALAALLILLNVVYFTYQLFWGLLYFQKPIFSESELREPTEVELKLLATKYLNECIALRSLVSEDSLGVFKLESLKSIEVEIISQQSQLPQIIPEKKATGILLFKPSLYSGVMSYSGILGYYNPFTAEAQYNAKLPSTSLPFTLAHESAHQLGFAREQEANFIGYLLGKNSTNTELLYSTNYFVLRNLLWSLYSVDPKFVEETLELYSEGMRRDAEAAKLFNEKHEGVFDDFFQWTNDLFLKSNQQEGRVTYSYFVHLLVHYEMSLP